MASITILDVGHGNSAVLQTGSDTIVIDGGSHQVLKQYLRNLELTLIDAVLISHSDYDHIGGIIELLLDPTFVIKKVYVNPDAKNPSSTWLAIRTALGKASTTNGTQVVSLTTQSTSDFSWGPVSAVVLAPSIPMSLSGVGGQDIGEGIITSNSMSAVIKVMWNQVGKVLLAADMDMLAFGKIRQDVADLSSQVLVFPHHGGLPNDEDVIGFARSVCQAVQPKMVIFSIGRKRYDNPKEEIMRGVLEAVPSAHIACTQLSQMCAATITPNAKLESTIMHARGNAEQQCCAGTIKVYLDTDDLECAPSQKEHSAFVSQVATTPLCRRLMPDKLIQIQKHPKSNPKVSS